MQAGMTRNGKTFALQRLKTAIVMRDET